MPDDAPLLLHHEYDGIKEYDNPTPSWWHLIFLATIIFSVFYAFFAIFSPLYPSPQRTHAAAEERDFARKFAAVGDLQADEQTILTMTQNDESWRTLAASIFKGNCVSCHGPNAEGQVGPNLTDEHYLNVKTPTDLYDVILNGANAGAMPSWRNKLHHNEMVLLASYAAWLRGQDLDGPRGAEGEVIPPWPEVESPAESGESAGGS